jgi:hypothetical protein
MMELSTHINGVPQHEEFYDAKQGIAGVGMDVQREAVARCLSVTFKPGQLPTSIKLG